jgi:uncharacterized protein YxjI
MPERGAKRYEVRHQLFPPDAMCVVTDHRGRLLFASASNPESAGRSIALRTTTNLAVAEVRYNMLGPRPACEIIRNDAVILELREDLYSLAERRFTASGPAGEYELRGDWPNWKILVTQDERPMGEILQDPSTLGDHYAVDVAPEADLVSMLCLAIGLHELTVSAVS